MERDFLVYAVDLCIGIDTGEEFSGVCRRVVSKETDTLRKSCYGVCSFVYRDTDNN